MPDDHEAGDSIAAVYEGLSPARLAGDSSQAGCVAFFLMRLDALAAEPMERAAITYRLQGRLADAVRRNAISTGRLLPPGLPWRSLPTHQRLWVVALLADVRNHAARAELLKIALAELRGLQVAFSDSVYSSFADGQGVFLPIETYVFFRSVIDLAMQNDADALRTILRAAEQPRTLRRYVENVLRYACLDATESSGRAGSLACY